MTRMPSIDTSAHYKDALFWFAGPREYGHPTKEDFEQAWGQTEGEAYAKALYARLERNGLIEPGPAKSIKLSAKGEDEREHLRREGQPRYL